MSPSQAASVKSGLPWWLWTMLAIATVAIGAGVILSSIPDDPQAVYETAKEALENRQSEKFAKSLDQLRQYPEYTPEVTFLEGMLAMSQRREPRALELYEKASEDKELLPSVLPEIGACKTQIGDYDGAIEAYEQAIELSPKSASESRILLSRLYYMVGAKTLSQQVVETVVEDEPRNIDARVLLATNCKEFERYDEALQQLLPVLDTPGDFASANPMMLELYVECLLEVEDMERLTVFEEKYLGAITDKKLIAKIALATGNADEARGALADSVEGGMVSPATKLAYAELELAEGGDSAKAQPLIEQAIRFRPRDIEAWKVAKKYYEKKDDKERAANAQQNIDELEILNDKLLKSYEAVSMDVNDVEGRVAVMKALIQVGKFEDAQRWRSLLVKMAPEIDARKIFEDEAKTLTVLAPLEDSADKDTDEPKDAKADNEAEEAKPEPKDAKADKEAEEAKPEPKDAKDAKADKEAEEAKPEPKDAKADKEAEESKPEPKDAKADKEAESKPAKDEAK